MEETVQTIHTGMLRCNIFLCKKTSGRRFGASAVQQNDVVSMAIWLKGADHRAFFEVSPLDPGESRRKIRVATTHADAYSRQPLH